MHLPILVRQADNHRLAVMSASNASGGVRNLRAMFENKGGDQSTSPPSRGRSPSNSVASTSSRPVSKVRASFVAVERPGEQGQFWGLRKASDVSSMAEVKENETSIIDGPPLSTTHTTPERDSSGGLGNILKGSSFAATPLKEKPNAMESVQKNGQAAPKRSVDDHKQPKSNGVGNRATEAAKKIQEKAKPSTTKPNPKPIETKAPVPTKTEKPSPRTPTSAGVKPRGGVAKIKGVMDSAKKAAEGREATRKAGVAKVDSAPASPAKINGQRKEAAHSPRAVTKPGRLPSAATAPTAASAAHTHKEPEPAKKPVQSSKPGKLPSAVTAMTAASAAHDRSVPDSQAKRSAARRTSAAQANHPRLSTASTQSSLSKKASRASLADRPKSRSSLSKPDDGFLARMMRPTQSSAQKTHEKTHISSPPRAKPAAAKTKPASKANLTGHSHHDHVDPAGDYAVKTPISPAKAGHSVPRSAKKVQDATKTSPETHDPVVEEAPMTVAEAQAPIKGSSHVSTAYPRMASEPVSVEPSATAVHEKTETPELSAVVTESNAPGIEIKPEESTATDGPEALPALSSKTEPTVTGDNAPTFAPADKHQPTEEKTSEDKLPQAAEVEPSATADTMTTNPETEAVAV